MPTLLSLALVGFGTIGIATRNSEMCDKFRTESGGIYKPVRVHIEIANGEEANNEQSEFLTKVLVPHAKKFIETTFETIPLATPKSIPPQSCGGYGIPEIIMYDEDLVALIILERSDKGVRMSTTHCSLDDCGRTLFGIITIYLDKLEHQGFGAENSINTMTHELVHILGFSGNSYSRFSSAVAASPPLKIVKYSCNKDPKTHKFQVKWGLSDDTPITNTNDVYEHRFAPGVVKAIDARGLKASDCRCPFDPLRTYTDSDIMHCLEHPNHCAVAIITPKVVEATREYFDCPIAEGMELENASNSVCGRFYESHWKTLLIPGELMTLMTAGHSFVTPMTFAVVQDSGWYRLSSKAVPSVLIPGATPGFKTSCEYLSQSCSKRLKSDDRFCDPNKDIIRCDNDALGLSLCSRKYFQEGTIHHSKTLREYKHKSSMVAMRFFDHCPAFVPLQTCSGPSERCLMTRFGSVKKSGFINRIKRRIGMSSGFHTPEPVCLVVSCSLDKQTYSVHVAGGKFRGKCSRKDEIIDSGSIIIICQDPVIICASWNFPHHSSGSNMNQVPY